MDKDCFVLIEDDWVEAELIGVYQISNVIDPSPFAGGHSGGVVAYPAAVVRVNDKLQEFRLRNVIFQDERIPFREGSE